MSLPTWAPDGFGGFGSSISSPVSELGGCHMAELTKGHHEPILCRAAGLSWQAGLVPHLLFAALVQVKDELQLLWLQGVENDDGQPQEQGQQPCRAQTDTVTPLQGPAGPSSTQLHTRDRWHHPAGQAKVLISLSPSGF